MSSLIHQCLKQILNINVKIAVMDKEPDSIKEKIERKKKAEKMVKDYLKPSCDEELSEEEYPQIKDKQ